MLSHNYNTIGMTYKLTLLCYLRIYYTKINAYNESQTNFIQKRSKCVYVLKIIEVLSIIRFFFHLRRFHLKRVL